MRTCIGCRRRASQTDLDRLSVQDDDLVIRHRGAGRGAWLCPEPDCLDQAVRRRAIGRSLRTEFTPGAFDRLRAAFVSAIRS